MLKRFQLSDKIFPVTYSEDDDFKSDIRFLWSLACLVPKLHELLQCLRFRLFAKVSKYYDLNCYFFEDAYCK